MAFFYSLSGGFAAFLVMWALCKPLGEQKLWVLSAFGAMGHNLGQMAAAVLISRTKRNFVLSSGPAGFRHCDRVFTGLCAQLVSKRARQAGLFSK